jgi:predicted DNA repair protein MutK
MAFASLFTLLDDITAVLDDVALMTKMAAKKTAGVVGDDLALNANQVTGVAADRELPIVWAVAKGSLINKVILVPLALAISYFAPWLVMPLLMIGGAYLCFEGVEKLLHKFTHKHSDTATAPTVMTDELLDEKAKIRGAIRTDFILSAEIIIIALGVVAHMGMAQKAMVMSIIGIGMTVLVYGLVAGIVKLDDIGNWLQGKSSAAARSVGRGLILLMPWFMRALAVVGMLAMFLVGGGIIVHGLAPVSEFLHAHHWENGLPGMLASLVVGLVTGALVCAVVLPLMKLFNKSAAAAH